LGADGHGYVLADNSINARPEGWGRVVASVYDAWHADRVVAESNYGGDMVEGVIVSVNPGIPVKLVRATRGKLVRAEPVSAKYEQGRIHHAGVFSHLEDEMCGYTPDTTVSPNRLDAMVWAFTELFGIGRADWLPSAGAMQRGPFGGKVLNKKSNIK
jgi:phage terminase large subunit-like protein